MRTRGRIVGTVALLCAPLLAFLVLRAAPGQSPGPSGAPSGGSANSGYSTDYSNVREEDYVGPEVCGECHDDRYQEWQGNLHRRMNRSATEPGAVLGNFDDHREVYAGGEVQFESGSGGYRMTFTREGEVHRSYRITRTIGSRYLQEYVGIQTVGPEAAGHELYAREIRLPFGYLLSDESWLHQQYLDSWHGEEYTDTGELATSVFDPETAPWRGRCAWCHNTYSFDKRLARLQGDEQIGSGIEMLYTDALANAPLPGNLLAVDTLVSVGISCESCHFGGREHAILGKPIRFEPAGAGIAKNSQAPEVAGTRNDARTINAICAQCHSTPTALYPNGAGTRNSSEALDLLSGACASQIKCTDCHNPHVPGPGALAPDVNEHIGACLSCHQNLADAELAQVHTQHSEAVSCLDCHMPRMVQGIDELIRSHRISSPDDEEMLATSLNACNLCHLEKSIAWTREHLVSDFSVSLKAWPTTATETETATTAPDQPAVRQWLSSDSRIQRLTAAAALGYSAQGTNFLGDLLTLLDAPVAYDRLRYKWAIEDIVGRDLSKEEYDLTAAPAIRATQAEALLRTGLRPTPTQQ